MGLFSRDSKADLAAEAKQVEANLAVARRNESLYGDSPRRKEDTHVGMYEAQLAEIKREQRRRG